MIYSSVCRPRSLIDLLKNLHLNLSDISLCDFSSFPQDSTLLSHKKVYYDSAIKISASSPNSFWLPKPAEGCTHYGFTFIFPHLEYLK